MTAKGVDRSKGTWPILSEKSVNLNHNVNAFSPLSLKKPSVTTSLSPSLSLPPLPLFFSENPSYINLPLNLSKKTLLHALATNLTWPCLRQPHPSLHHSNSSPHSFSDGSPFPLSLHQCELQPSSLLLPFPVSTRLFATMEHRSCPFFSSSEFFQDCYQIPMLLLIFLNIFFIIYKILGLSYLILFWFVLCYLDDLILDFIVVIIRFWKLN